MGCQHTSVEGDLGVEETDQVSPLWKSTVNVGQKIVGDPKNYFGHMLRLSILEPALELSSRAAPSVEAHYCVNGPNTERNSGGRQIKKYA